LIGSLMVLAMLERAGWSLTISTVAVLAALAAVPFLLHGERGKGGDARAFPSIARILRTPGMAGRVGFVVLLGLALGIGLGAPRLLMVAQGFPLASIGAIFGPVGAIAGVVGAVAGTALGSRYGLPLTLRLAASLFFAAVAAMAAGFGEEVRDIGLFGPVIVAGVVAYAAIFAGICALAMGWVGSEQAATDYSTVLSAWNLSLVLG
ncbi:hypothetical protein AB4144_42455, partial [Rhizobiaceae sp. 2RAB30]